MGQIAGELAEVLLNTPGGLKIQTIHSFCESLLARFPIESGVTPQTQVMDERSAAELMRTARDAVLMASKAQPALSDALEEVTSHLQEEQFTELIHDQSNYSTIVVPKNLSRAQQE